MDEKVNALLYEPPSVTVRQVIDGKYVDKTFRRKRLGIQEEVKLAELFVSMGVDLTQFVDEKKMKDPNELIGTVIAVLPYAIDSVLEFFRTILLTADGEPFPLTVEQMKDPYLWPLGATEDVLKTLVEDEEVRAFFVDKLPSLVKAVSGSRSPNKSSLLKRVTDGLTKK